MKQLKIHFLIASRSLLLLSILFFIALLSSCSVFRQPAVFIERDHELYLLEARLIKGDKSALVEIAPYFNSRKRVIEFLGHHRLEVRESSIAQRIVRENVSFTKNEFNTKKQMSGEKFAVFLENNMEEIFFSMWSSSFLITPLDRRHVKFQLRKVSYRRSQVLRDSSSAILNISWVKANKIDSLIQKKDPKALLYLVSELYKIRARHNRYHFYKDEFTDLLHLITGVEIGVENSDGALTWKAAEDYSYTTTLNLLIYYSRYYRYFYWDEKSSCFVNPNHEVRGINKVELYFQLLKDKNDSLVVDAFSKLTSCDFKEVNEQLLIEEQTYNWNRNYAIPIFPYKFLRQLTQLTEYCERNGIDYKGSKALQNKIQRLKDFKLPFPERRSLENELVVSLTLDEITAFEYWSLIRQNSWGVTYSAGRILDIWYSKNWNKMINSDKHLACYLKKSGLFHDLGIIGSCNSYLHKFSNAEKHVQMRLKKIKSKDDQIKDQIKNALIICKKPVAMKKRDKISVANKDYEIENLELQLRLMINNVVDSSKTERKITKLLSGISFEQIKIAADAIEEYPFKLKWGKYGFIESDFGFFKIGDMDKQKSREEFLVLYKKFDKYGLYEYLLNKNKIDYRTPNKALDYDKMYDLLKYDVVTAIAGGGGGTQDNEVYGLVKLLELTFNTTLGYPKKLCNSNNMYGCSSEAQANTWMDYLVENKLLKKLHDEPISFFYE